MKSIVRNKSASAAAVLPLITRVIVILSDTSLGLTRMSLVPSSC
jgi:hypothetical protein